ncbi:hypothetical protein HPB48_006155 [Haemaphysalis longicornis]|uniref:Carboxylesterase type B domain-containing protein n=1 Tax=Haemaphysalis longicornis TaxID=44386 RepID=A0A9J6GXP9_HAELO|nr:hypothetical protein HPB48_006155 [Haemaphysalis longicornis]
MDSKTVMDARSSRPGCVQIPYVANGRVIRRNEDTSEDCLHLNVWTPCTEKTEAGCRKTVLVFFHGQSFQEGDNNYYDGKWLAGLGQVVVVAPNFRLGAFGFLNLGCPEKRGWSANDFDCAPGDVGLDDQRLAVEWVVANIGSFGGNSKDIVLVGSGSGAWSVGAHILGASARGTSDQFWNNARFTKVILMSDSPLKRSFPARSHALSARLGCSSDDVAEELRCMRNKTARDILDRTREPEDYLGPSVVATPARARQVSGGRFFIGTVSNEGSHLADTVKRATSGQGDMTTSVANFLNTTYGLVVPLQVYDAYRNSSAFFHGGVVDEEWWMSQLMGDIRFTCPLLTLGQELASVDENKVFGYIFDHRASFALFNHTAGAPRFSELDFVFGVPLDGSRHATPEEERLSRTVIDIWSGFARTGYARGIAQSVNVIPKGRLRG